AAQAALSARNQRKKATLTYAKGYDGAFNSYRRPQVYTEDDADPTLNILQAKNSLGQVLGNIVQYAAHPTGVGTGAGGDRGRAVHADYVIGLEDTIESATGGAATLFYNGPIADASPSGPTVGNDDYQRVRSRGTCLAQDALALLDPQQALCSFAELKQAQVTRTTLQPQLSVRNTTAVMPVTNPLFLAVALTESFNRYYDFLQLPVDQIPALGPQIAALSPNLPQVAPVAQSEVSRITVGGADQGLEIVTIPGEGTNTFGRYIRGLTANKNMMLLGLTHNSFGYIIPEEEFSYVDPAINCVQGSSDPFCNEGFVFPFTGYEEFVSLGPLTAALLRDEAYNPLFDLPATDPRNLPPSATACATDPTGRACLLSHVIANVSYIQRSDAQACRRSLASQVPADQQAAAQAFCGLLDPDTPLHQPCVDAGGPQAVCDALGNGSAAPSDTTLLAPALDALLRGCDFLDTSNCLYPFPNDHFTVDAPAGSPQSAEAGGTGRRLSISFAATPHNSAGKPVDPTEWNRNDGFSPGALITTYVPGISLENTYGLPTSQIGVVNAGLSLADDSPIMVLEVPQAPESLTPQHALVWSELDANANLLLPAAAPIVGSASDNSIPFDQFNRPLNDGKAALLIRPAKNLAEGRRYVVVLRKLKDANGTALTAQDGFAACRDKVSSLLPPVQQRCAELEANVFPVLAAAGVARDASLYLAWDFTVASTNNQVGRLRHMRDDAFATLAAHDGADCSEAHEGSDCHAPAFTVDTVTDNPQQGIVKRIEGTITVPSYLVPADASQLEYPAVTQVVSQLCGFMPDAAPSQLRDLCGTLRDGSGTVQGASLPPNRLAYTPSLNPADPQGSLYGNGLPTRTGTMSTRYMCQIPAQASPDDPARPAIYGHGLLDSHVAVTYDGVPEVSREFNRMYCAVDWYGFATGDLGNVITALVDLSNFAVVPDASQQGVLNFMFLGRLLRDAGGFASNPAFQDSATGRPLFDRSEVFYDGNSQGGIMGGVVIAADKDIHRGVLGSLGMNYSTLLTRSRDFDQYAGALYLSYTDPLDRQLLFSMIQMLWDRSENDGYAAHLTDNSAFGGQSKAVKLDPNFGDQQVSLWTADVMARTMGIPYNADQTDRAAAILGENPRNPDVVPYLGLQPLDFSDPAQAAGSAMIVWDSKHNGAYADIPPLNNTPPRTGPDPHDNSAKTTSGRCQKAHFLRTGGQLIDITDLEFDPANNTCPAVPKAAPTVAVPQLSSYGTGVLGALAQFMHEANGAFMALVQGDYTDAGIALQTAFANFSSNLGQVLGGGSASAAVLAQDAANNLSNPQVLASQLGADAGALAGLDTDAISAATRATSANRNAIAVVLTGVQVPAWSVPAAQGVPYPYPSGATISGQLFDALGVIPGQVHDAHNGVMLYPVPGSPTGKPVERIAAYKWDGTQFVEIPVQVDEKFPFFLANADSSFSVYSGTDEELTYAWDLERWQNTDDPANLCNAGYSKGMADPVAGLDDDDEIAFMAQDSGAQAPQGARPADPDLDPAETLQMVALVDALDPQAQRYVYLGLKKDGRLPKFAGQKVYVDYERDANADQWIDRTFFADSDPLKLGTSNTGYGPNRHGKVCGDGTPASARDSTDRFPRDGTRVTTDAYQWYASGRWMVREMHVARPNQSLPAGRAPGAGVKFGADLVDRWKGRAFQQAPDSNISIVGFEDEQVNWEANSTLLGERCGPVRCMREVWGADSGTNVTKTETFYRDAVAYRYHVRVHPIPPDGLYTSWDYNRSAMIPDANERVPGGRYYTILRPQGVPIDGVNDDVGQVDSLTTLPVNGQCVSPDNNGLVPPNPDGHCPAFFDVADPTFNLPLAFDNWEQVSGKGNLGSLVYTFELKGPTSLANPLVIPFYRDDACLDDGTGDDPVQRPYPGEAQSDPRVRAGYVAAAGGDPNHNVDAQFVSLGCEQKQGAYGAHGVHYLVTHDSDNAFLLGKPIDEVDGQQWQFAVPTPRPMNVAEPYANDIRVPLTGVAVPAP
ncbi:MAG TPA: hypothetical protein VHE37_03670, partial [Nevskiaceae bacterium]|nr:hypothetical protein [Nevskiaceae bacterium]